VHAWKEKLNNYAGEAKEREKSGMSDTKDESEVDKDTNESKLKSDK
jgi:hypothetical protein